MFSLMTVCCIYIGSILLQLWTPSPVVCVQGGQEAFIWLETNVPSTIGMYDEFNNNYGIGDNVNAMGYIIQTAPTPIEIQRHFVGWAVYENQYVERQITLVILPE